MQRPRGEDLSALQRDFERAFEGLAQQYGPDVLGDVNQFLKGYFQPEKKTGKAKKR
jgi:type I restriction-modification system DNA methylase subunit